MAYTTAQLVTAYTNANLGKAPDAATTLTLDAYATQSSTGGISDATALANTLKLVNSTTAVAIETYQFFTGGAPSAAGLAYLVNSTTNTSDLNDTYYSKFAQENRFINFSINLATGSGAGASAFATAYGSVSIAQAVATAYDKIIGNANATAAGVDPAAAVAYLTRADNITYLTAFVKANTGFTAAADIDLAVKAALIGEILNAATVSGIGGYAKSTAAMINDLSDGALSTDAPGGVNILTAYPNGGIVGSSLTLTTGVDTVAGTVNDDTITALIDGTTGAVATTLTALDTINGGAGNDTINLNVINGVGVAGTAVASIPSVSVSNVETANVRAAVAFTGDFSTWGLTSLNFTQGAAVSLTAAGTTNVAVSGATGNIAVIGGLGVSVTDATAGTTITIGAGTAPKGAVSVTDTNQTSGNITIDGGTTVTVAASKNSGGTITVGGTTAATGAVSISSTGAAFVAGSTPTLGALTATGGTSITVTQTASSDLSAQLKDPAGLTTSVITQGAVNVNGDKNTTEVTVTETAAQTGVDYVAAAGGKEVQTLTFTAMASGDTVSVNGLTFTAAKALTASEVASAFANLAASAFTGSAPVSSGSYSGQFSTLGFVSSAASGATVTLTGSANGNLAAATVAATGTATAPSVVTVTDGVATTTGVTGAVTIVSGAVTINGAITGADVLAKATLSGYGATTIASDALATLNLANSDASVAVTNATTTTLALGLNAVGTTTAATLGLGATYTTLNVATSGASAAQITAAGVTALAASGSAALDLSGSTLAALKTVTVSGAGGLTIDASGATVTSVDTSASTGKNAIKIDGSAATFTGGAGADTVTLSSTTVNKAIALGDGDDTLSLAAGTTALGVVVSGGNGTDTLKLNAADAVTASATAAFGTKFTGFEKLSINAVGATGSIDLANLNNLNYVVLNAGISGAFTQTLANFGAAGTVELDAAGATGTVAVVLADATGTSDVLNLVTKNAGSINFGTVTAAGVETINLTSTDTATTTIDTHTVAITDAALKALTISGNAKVALTVGASSTLLATVDASAATGALTFATASTAAAGATVTGGSAADSLTANHSNDVLIGGAGNDTLTVGASANLVTLTGGAGADVFKITSAAQNVNSYATITDASAGDSITFANTAGTETFTSAKLALGDTAVFQDYANQAISSTVQGAITWFTYGGNTYIVEHVQAGGASFLNGTDIIVKLAGTPVDLSAASFGANNQTLVLH